MFPGIADGRVDKWNQQQKGGKARAGYQTKSQKGDFGSVLPGISGNSVVTCHSCFNQEQHLNFCMSQSLVKASSTTYQGKIAWELEDSPLTKI